MDTCVNETLPREPASVKPSRAAISAAALSFALLVTLTGCGGSELSESTTSEPTMEVTSALATCGNLKLEEAEQCDDGNTTDGDGCSATCTLEPRASCGNGTLDDFEQCDDGNTTSGDGCSDICTIEGGLSCTVSAASPAGPTTCAPECGDGIKDASEACDDGNRTSGDGCNATCTAVESTFGCKNSGKSAFITRRGRTDCTKVSDLTTPAPASIPAASSTQPALGTPDRFRIQYVSGAVSFSNNENWRPGIMGVVYSGTAGEQSFSVGYTEGFTTRNQALGLGFSTTPTAIARMQRDFEATTSDVRVAFIDNDCDLNNNTDNTITYRVDAVSICQLIPVVTDPPAGGITDPVLGGTATPGATVNVYIDGSTTPACTAVADSSGNWTCTISGYEEGVHTITRVTSTVLSATEESTPSIGFTLDDTPPDTTITKGPGESTENTTAEFEYASNESNVTYECSLDGQPYAPCQSTYTVNPGQHTLSARAVDEAGNVDPTPAVYTWTVTEPPPPAGEPPVFGGGGCSAAPVSSWLALLGLLGLRRRSRR